MKTVRVLFHNISKRYKKRRERGGKERGGKRRGGKEREAKVVGEHTRVNMTYGDNIAQ